MISKTVLAFSSDITVAKDDDIEFVNEFVRRNFPEDTEELIFFTRIEKKGKTIFRMDIDPMEQPENFRENLLSLVKEIGPICEAPFFIMVRSDTLDDERDEYIYGGPDDESIEAFRISHLSTRIKDLVRINARIATPRQVADVAAKILSNHTESAFTHEDARTILEISLSIATSSGMFDEMQETASNPDLINNFCDAFDAFKNPKNTEAQRP